MILEFVGNILDVTSETVPQDELESLDSDDKFNVEVWSVRPKTGLSGHCQKTLGRKLAYWFKLLILGSILSMFWEAHVHKVKHQFQQRSREMEIVTLGPFPIPSVEKKCTMLT